MQTLDTVHRILSQLKFGDWVFHTHVHEDGCFRIWATFVAPNNEIQTTRKWLISSHATRSEIVQTAFKVVLTALEHEAREEFLYDGEAIFGPHFDIEALYDIAHRRRLDKRTDLRTAVHAATHS